MQTKGSQGDLHLSLLLMLLSMFWHKLDSYFFVFVYDNYEMLYDFFRPPALMVPNSAPPCHGDGTCSRFALAALIFQRTNQRLSHHQVRPHRPSLCCQQLLWQRSATYATKCLWTLWTTPQTPPLPCGRVGLVL